MCLTLEPRNSFGGVANRVDWGWIGELFGGGLGVDWRGLGWIGAVRDRIVTYKTQYFGTRSHPGNLRELENNILLLVFQEVLHGVTFQEVSHGLTQ